MTAANKTEVRESQSRLPRAPAEALGIVTLLGLAIYFIAVSWRKWPDPINDVGPQWYTLWRLTQGARLYHDEIWNYGPLSPAFGALLFKLFGTGMMVVALANLVLYGVIIKLAYLVFRRAWGPLGAFCALAVFISVFSFSRLNSIANYNYATPYANESTHGILLILVTALIAVRWCRGPSRPLAFALGTCGGLAAVLKPEFMLAGAAVGILACLVRSLQKQRVCLGEYLCALPGLVWPTLIFTVWFQHRESETAAFIDASQAWWLVLVNRAQAVLPQQKLFLGLDHPWADAFVEFKAASIAILTIGIVLALGWLVNRRRDFATRAVMTVLTLALLYFLLPGFPKDDQPTGWLYIGSAFPGLMAVVVLIIATHAWQEIRGAGRARESTLMALTLAVIGLTMLARMLLHARIHHLGFYQAAIAGMVIAAFLVVEIPRWTGPGREGRTFATALSALMLGLGCVSIAVESHRALADQTVPVGSGRDRFYAAVPEVDLTGTLVDWLLDYFGPIPPDKTIAVLPEGEMVNYLLRRHSPLGTARSDSEIVARFDAQPPDYVVFISRDFSEQGLKEYGAPGGPGYAILQWLKSHRYDIAATTGGNPLVTGQPKGAVILRKPREPVSAPN